MVSLLQINSMGFLIVYKVLLCSVWNTSTTYRRGYDILVFSFTNRKIAPPPLVVSITICCLIEDVMHYFFTRYSYFEKPWCNT